MKFLLSRVGGTDQSGRRHEGLEKPMPAAGRAERTQMSAKSMRGGLWKSMYFSDQCGVFAAAMVSSAAQAHVAQ
jgi:hypothetical protein